MRKIIILAFAVLFFWGCSQTTPKIALSSSDAVFVTPKAGENKIYAMFKNTAGLENSNLTQKILAEFGAAGFTSVQNISDADFVVLGDILSFTRTQVRSYDAYMGMYGGRRSMGFGLGFPLFGWDDGVGSEYYYAMSVSVLIRQKGSEDKSTNITVKNGGNVYSPSYILPIFEERIAKQIVGFFYKF